MNTYRLPAAQASESVADECAKLVSTHLNLSKIKKQQKAEKQFNRVREVFLKKIKKEASEGSTYFIFSERKNAGSIAPFSLWFIEWSKPLFALLIAEFKTLGFQVSSDGYSEITISWS